MLGAVSIDSVLVDEINVLFAQRVCAQFAVFLVAFSRRMETARPFHLSVGQDQPATRAYAHSAPHFLPPFPVAFAVTAMGSSKGWHLLLSPSASPASSRIFRRGTYPATDRLQISGTSARLPGKKRRHPRVARVAHTNDGLDVRRPHCRIPQNLKKEHRANPGVPGSQAEITSSRPCRSFRCYCLCFLPECRRRPLPSSGTWLPQKRRFATRSGSPSSGR